MKFRWEAPRSVVLAATAMCSPIVVVTAAGAAAEGFDTTSVVVLSIVVAGAALAVGAARRTAVVVEVDERAIVLGLVPFRRTRLLPEDVQAVDVIAVDGHPRWTGWGIKGCAHRSPGLLYSVGGRHGVRVVTDDGRRFVVAVPQAQDARRAAEAVGRALPQVPGALSDLA